MRKARVSRKICTTTVSPVTPIPPSTCTQRSATRNSASDTELDFFAQVHAQKIPLAATSSRACSEVPDTFRFRWNLDHPQTLHTKIYNNQLFNYPIYLPNSAGPKIRVFNRIFLTRHCALIEKQGAYESATCEMDFSNTLGMAGSVEKTFHSGSQQIASENVSLVFSTLRSQQ